MLEIVHMLHRKIIVLLK